MAAQYLDIKCLVELIGWEPACGLTPNTFLHM